MRQDGPRLSSAPRVQLLSESLINKIAAGEVLERPASAVKELVENAIDAEASRIRVEMEGGGRSLIRVVDDGIGMGRDDALLALKRHATSKIASDEDLFAIRTLGFRGEALPSIAEVSRFELTTGRRGEDAGTRLLVDGGEVQRVEDAPNPGGTDIQVRRLFFNTPVRLKFLKTPRTEMSHVTQTVTRLAMAHPHVAFELVSDGRRLLDAPRSNDLSGRLRSLLGPAVAGAMHDFGEASADLRAEGLLSDSTLHRSTNAGVHVFVNGRHVRDRTLIAAVLAAYKAHLPRGRYPVVCVFVDLPPDRLDVNVHPAKTEVRFRDGRRLYRFLSSAIERRLGALGGENLDSIVGAPAVQRGLPLPSKQAPTFWGARQARLMDRAPVRRTTQPSTPAPQVPTPLLERSVRPSAVVPRPDGAEAPRFSELRVLGAFQGSVLVCAAGAELVFVDQQAARERILFERLARRSPEAPVKAQRLLVPALLEVERRLADVMVAFEPLLVDLGIEVSSFGDGTLSVHALPAGVDVRRAHPLVVELAEALRGRLEGRTGPRLRVDLARITARHCEPSKELFPEEIEQLFETLDAIDFSQDGPETRAIVVRFSRRAVDAWFARSAPR